jgi:hypothetical protein
MNWSVIRFYRTPQGQEAFVEQTLPVKESGFILHCKIIYAIESMVCCVSKNKRSFEI